MPPACITPHTPCNPCALCLACTHPLCTSASPTTRAPLPQVHRLLLADSGTLLLCSVDRSGNLAKLRARLRASFPGAPSTQSSIMHASIARLLSTEQLTVAQIERVQVRLWGARGPVGLVLQLSADPEAKNG